MEGCQITHKMLNHPGGSLAYRFEAKGKVCVYATDTEPYQKVLLSAATKLDEKKGFDKKLKDHLNLLQKELIAFVKGADVLIYDTQYTENEYPRKVGFGHGYPGYALEIALAAKVKQLVLFHHDPNHPDKVVDAEVKAIRAGLRKVKGAQLTINPAYEGLEIKL
jgi:ribonuclease BN (tRNA processing enzyme)